jgi:hypothetical protein
MSILLIVPIVAVAVYMVYKYLKREVSGNGDACCGCSLREKCENDKLKTA